MRNIVSGVVGVLFGGFILLSALLRGGPQGSGPYFTGQVIGLLTGVLLFVGGFYYLWKGTRGDTPKRSAGTKPSKRPSTQPPGTAGLPPRRTGR